MLAARRASVALRAAVRTHAVRATVRTVRPSRAIASVVHASGGAACRVPLRVQAARAFSAAATPRDKVAAADLKGIPEVKQRTKLAELLAAGDASAMQTPPVLTSAQEVGVGKEDMMRLVQVAMSTFLLHVEARVFAYVGEGFYTIGPCGEEAMAGLGLAMRQEDPAALHYRHVGTQMARQLASGKPLDEVLLDRARGYTVSSLDPVTAGAHCAIGGGPADFLVTSTLSSQTPPAVGRAMAIPLTSHLGVKGPFPRDAVSVVTVGDGSVNNGHFLSAVNLAEYTAHRGRKCPVLFGITDNDRCISLRGYRWIQQYVRGLKMPHIVADGRDVLDVYDRVRKNQRPAALLVEHVPRRFGHAATDRQNAYSSKEEIEEVQNCDPIQGMCVQAVNAGYTTFAELHDMFTGLQAKVEAAFDTAAAEPKLTDRAALLERVSASLAPTPAGVKQTPQAVAPNAPGDSKSFVPMRGHMTAVIAESMNKYNNAVYIGEDVRHGGYYLVTDKLVNKFPDRVHDFPPDETTLVGAGVGFAQAGLLPIVEIPYAKYLDCGADMFFEAVLLHWLSNGRQPNGMLLRLQGFGDGVFGGNFHTHNSLHIPPGLDVVCYSNGRDYARGFRYAMRQAAAGRVVMSVDSTNLLYMRHLHGSDEARVQQLSGADEELDWDTVRVHGEVKTGRGANRLAIVTYGNGVVTSLQANKLLADEHGISDAVIIDCPYLSSPPAQLRELLPSFDAVVFADVCKVGQHPFAGFVTQLQTSGELPAAWRCVGAQPTYNPLGQRTTFLSTQDVVEAVLAVASKA